MMIGFLSYLVGGARVLIHFFFVYELTFSLQIVNFDYIYFQLQERLKSQIFIIPHRKLFEIVFPSFGI